MFFLLTEPCFFSIKVVRCWVTKQEEAHSSGVAAVGIREGRGGIWSETRRSMSSIGNSWGRKCQTKETEGVWGCELAVGVVWLWSEGNLEGWSETRGTWRVDEQNYPASKGTMWQLRHFLHSNQAKHVHPPYLLHSRFNTTSLLLPLSKMFTSCPFTLSQADVMNVWKSCLPKKNSVELAQHFCLQATHNIYL